ncbi:MAG: hypothetical protein C4334_03760 [Pyrinomonas sp.]|uniref:FkbM family methyltransferase n=1 Tax=Pyrinomonas sp. TaxID=2080306 RepID=UPI00332ED8F8
MPSSAQQALLNRSLKLLVRGFKFKRGRERLVAFAMRRVAGWELGRDLWGNLFLLDLASYIDSRLFLEGSYEAETIRALRCAIEEQGYTHFVDVGANIGVHTVALGSCPAIERVFAFEPDARSRAQLVANLLLNDLDRKVELYDLALSSSEGEAVLHRSDEPKDFDAGKRNLGTHSLHFNAARHATSATVVRTSRLDRLLPLRGERVVVKIDVEGHELEVLRGMTEFLESNQCLLLVELFGGNVDVAIALLSKQGYVLRERFAEANYAFAKEKRR